ncbi:DUF4352 domain-containing protein [Frankia nepalensis]|uniref:DUF4352 domain-containing protein n=1 Tax=Frankia nepalensis TaxID=1836974 RepID=UPI0027DBAABA|nr:DUF4352 domain-containing protein [Frankia nepalensis]
MSDQYPHNPPDGGGGWPPATPAPDWQASPGGHDPAGHTPHPTPPGQAPPPPGQGWPGSAPDGGQWPPAGHGQPGYPQGAQGTPPPGGYPYPPAGGYQQPGTPPPGAYQPTTPYPQAGYPQGQPGYQDAGFQQGGYPPAGGTPAPWAGGPGQPPGQPPRRSNRNGIILIVSLAVVAAIVLGVVIALAVNGDDEKKPVTVQPTLPAVTNLPPQGGQSTAPQGSAPPATTAQGAPATAVPGAPADCKQVGVPAGAPPAGVLDIGQTGTVEGEDYSDEVIYKAQITLHGICTTTSAVRSYGDPPENGLFVIANFTVQMISGQANVFGIHFFGLAEDGSRYDATYTEVGSMLNADDLKAGQKVRGNIVFDVPQDVHLVYWEPLFATSQVTFRY